MYEAMRAANAPQGAEWSPYAEVKKAGVKGNYTPLKQYKEVVFVGKEDSKLKQIIEAQRVVLSSKISVPNQSIYIIDGTEVLDASVRKGMERNIKQGADVWIWNPTPQTLQMYNELLPLPLELEKREI